MSINESSGSLLVKSAGRPLLMTDFRYQLQAEEEAPGFDIFSILSLVSVLALLGCVQIIHSDTGKKWFLKK